MRRAASLQWRSMNRIPLWDKTGAVVDYAWVDAADFERVLSRGPWQKHSGGYACCHETRAGKRCVLLMHRFILGLTDSRIHTDHKNHDRLDNCRMNLQAGTQQENNKNSSPHPRSDSSSRFKGVGRYRGGWRAQGWEDGRTVWLGKHSTEEQARKVYSLWLTR